MQSPPLPQDLYFLIVLLSSSLPFLPTFWNPFGFLNYAPNPSKLHQQKKEVAFGDCLLWSWGEARSCHLWKQHFWQSFRQNPQILNNWHSWLQVEIFPSIGGGCSAWWWWSVWAGNKSVSGEAGAGRDFIQQRGKGQQNSAGIENSSII